MLPLPPFDYECPDRLEDAIGLLAETDTRLIAGGTDLLPSMKHRLFQPKTLVSLRKLNELKGVRSEGSGISIGASTTLLQLRDNSLVQEMAPALVDAASTIGTRTIQAMGTIGGNLALDTRCVYYNQPEGWRRAIDGCLKCEGSVCHVARTGDGCYATHSADTVPVLWLMNAEIDLHSEQGHRRIPIHALYDGEDGRRWLKLRPGEIITRVHIPEPTSNIVHHKVRLRQAIDYGALLVAVQSQSEGGARAVISALGPAPIEVSVDSASELEEAAFRKSRPLNTHIVETGWRKHMIRIAIRRALAQAQS